MESELGNDAVYGSFADGEVALSEFLSNDFGAGFRIQESVADDLTDEFLGAPVVGFWSSFGAEESLAALFKKKGPDLEIALAAITEFSGGSINAFRAAFALDEHGEFPSDFVVLGNGQGTGLALDAFLEKFERNHRDLQDRLPQLVYLNMAHYWVGGKRKQKTFGENPEIIASGDLKWAGYCAIFN